MVTDVYGVRSRKIESPLPSQPNLSITTPGTHQRPGLKGDARGIPLAVLGTKRDGQRPERSFSVLRK